MVVTSTTTAAAATTVTSVMYRRTGVAQGCRCAGSKAGHWAIPHPKRLHSLQAPLCPADARATRNER